MAWSLAASNRDILDTSVLAVLAGYQSYAHISALHGGHGDTINAPLLERKTLVSEDSVRRNLGQLDEA